MIKQFEIKNFKSHANTELKLSNMNVFTGLNGMGKSSVIQALLLLRQTYLSGMSFLSEGLELKGDLCNIGVAKDALYQSAENDLITFSFINDNEEHLSWSFQVNDKKLADTFIKLQESSSVDLLTLISNSLFNKKFQYLSAFRNGPAQDYDKDTATVELFHQISKKEGRCELIAHYLDYFKDEPISDVSLKKHQDDDDSLIFQVKRWLEDISPEINIHVEALELSYRINYSFSRGKNQVPTEKFKALNVGFGISYVLPIIVAALHAPKGSIIIIENPEAHIHPDGQAKLMELLCKAAKAGVQFIIETHSDHIINGLLISTKNNIIESVDSSVYFFDKDITTHSTSVTFLPVLPNGRIRKPPVGFFDRIEKDMKNLMGF